MVTFRFWASLRRSLCSFAVTRTVSMVARRSFSAFGGRPILLTFAFLSLIAIHRIYFMTIQKVKDS